MRDTQEEKGLWLLFNNNKNNNNNNNNNMGFHWFHHHNMNMTTCSQYDADGVGFVWHRSCHQPVNQRAAEINKTEGLASPQN